jgi:hypothetical protein
MSQIGDFMAVFHSLRQLFGAARTLFEFANSLPTLAHHGQSCQAWDVDPNTAVVIRESG